MCDSEIFSATGGHERRHLGGRGLLFASFLVSLSIHLGLLFVPEGFQLSPTRLNDPLPALLHVTALPQSPPPNIATTRISDSTASAEDTMQSNRTPIGSPASAQYLEPNPRTLSLAGKIFYPAEILTRRPAALIVGDFENHATEELVVSGAIVLQIWIDDQGSVVKVVTEESGLPPLFVDAAQQAFSAARFSPGERDGVAVSSVMRVEVTYDDDRLMRPVENGVPQEN